VIAVSWRDCFTAWRAAGGPPVDALGLTLGTEAAIAEVAWRADPWERGALLQALEIPLLRSTALGAERLDSWEAAGRPTSDPEAGLDLVYGDLELAETFRAACRLTHPAVVAHALRVLVVIASGISSKAWTDFSPPWRPIMTALSTKTDLFVALHELGHVWSKPLPAGLAPKPARETAAIEVQILKDPELQAAADRAEDRADSLARVWLTRP
jgi:hypothetical protein